MHNIKCTFCLTTARKLHTQTVQLPHSVAIAVMVTLLKAVGWECDMSDQFATISEDQSMLYRPIHSSGKV